MSWFAPRSTACQAPRYLSDAVLLVLLVVVNRGPARGSSAPFASLDGQRVATPAGQRGRRAPGATRLHIHTHTRRFNAGTHRPDRKHETYLDTEYLGGGNRQSGGEGSSFINVFYNPPRGQPQGGGAGGQSNSAVSRGRRSR